VAFAEDQNAVGEFGSGGQDEAFGEAVRSRTSRRDLHGVDADVSQDGVERVPHRRALRALFLIPAAVALLLVLPALREWWAWAAWAAGLAMFVGQVVIIRFVRKSSAHRGWGRW
jgi:uncharacterized membrane protein YecN with MAPEG domain